MIDGGSGVPPFEQVRAQLALLIEIGALPAGTRLPPVRQLANDLGLAKGTVSRAYTSLEADGLVRTARGGGTRVNPSVEHVPAVLDAAVEFTDRATAAGASLEQALAAVKAAWGGSAPGPATPDEVVVAPVEADVGSSVPTGQEPSGSRNSRRFPNGSSA